MKSKRFLNVLAALGLGAAMAGVASAGVPKSITVDGDMTTEWTADEMVTVQTVPNDGFGPALTLDSLNVTWDDDFLYIGLDGNQSGGDAVIVFVDGDLDGTADFGWRNTTNELADFGDNNARIESPASSLEILFPDGFRPKLFAGMRGNYENIGNATFDPNTDPNNDEDAGVRTWNTGDPGDVGYDCCSTTEHIINRTTRTTGGDPAEDSEMEIRIRWDRVFQVVPGAGAEEWAAADGVIPTNRSGSIGILAVLTNGNPSSGDGSATFTSNQFLPSLDDTDGGDVDNVGQNNEISTISEPIFLTGVATVNLDLNSNGILDGHSQDPGGAVADLAAGGRFGNLAAAPAFTATGAETFFTNDFLQVSYSLDPDDDSTTDTANYSFQNNTQTINVTAAEVGTGDFANSVFLTLDRAIDDQDVTDGTVLAINGVSDFGQAVNQTLSVAPKTIFTVTVDSSGDGQDFLPDPVIRGDWNGFGAGSPLQDNPDDLFPDVPGTQTEAGNTADDGIFMGRVFTSSALSGWKYAVRSEIFANDLTSYGVGYWDDVPFDRIIDVGAPDVSYTDRTQNRLTANQVTVTFNLTIPSGLTAPGDIVGAALLGGPAFGDEGNIPPLPIGGFGDGLAMTSTGTDGSGNATFTVDVIFAAGLPDVAEYHYAYQFTGPNDVFEQGSDFIQSEFTFPAGEDPADFAPDTIHGHTARLQQSAKTVGVTLNDTFGVLSFDVPAAPGAPTRVGSWSLYN